MTYSDTVKTGCSATSQRDQHIWLVTGPAGCGKSTVGKHIAEAKGFRYIEGDDFHPQANVEKMRNGTPLTDADRWDWLTRLRKESIEDLKQGKRGVVVTCSALKRKYRDVIRVAPYFNPSIQIHFIYLKASEETLLARVTARQNHYMGANMVRSQFQDLEPPEDDEFDIISIDVSQSAEVVKAQAAAHVSQAMGQDS